MRRREFIALFVGAATGPRAVLAQQPANTRIVGLLFLGPNDERFVRALRDGLRDNGLIDGDTVQILVRAADNDPQHVPVLARELADAGSLVIVTSGTTAVRAVHVSLPEMAIVMAASADPVVMGFAQSLARPGGKITGISILGVETLLGKNIELLKELVPSARAFAALLQAANPGNEVFRRGLAAAGRSLDVEMHFRDIHTRDDLAEAFEWASQVPVDGVFVIADPVFGGHRSTIGRLAEIKRLPWVGPGPDYAGAGAIAAYAVDYLRLMRDSARYVTQILRGAKPADLPIEQASKFRLIINLKTAKSLGLEIPASLLARADEVIE